MCGQHYYNHIADQFELVADKDDLYLAFRSGRARLREVNDKIISHRRKLEALAVANLRRADRRLVAMQPKTPPAQRDEVTAQLAGICGPETFDYLYDVDGGPWTCVGVAAPRPWTARWRHLPRPELTPPLATIRAAFGVGR
jgi:hypothetical protein